MNIVVICQEDNFVIPRNIFKLKLIDNIKVISVIEISSKGSLINKKELFLKGFGFYQCFKLTSILILNKILNILDIVFLRKFNFLMSIKAATLSLGSSFLKTENINSESVIKYLKGNNVDLIVSFSAPCIFRKELLEVPRYGCINLHCSLLPEFSGLLPSFWTLYEKASHIGATIHMMDNRIDNGDILDQVKLETPKNISIYENIKITKELGGNLMVKVIKKIIKNEITKIDNKYDEKKYRTWPTIDQLKEFRKDGGKLV